MSETKTEKPRKKIVLEVPLTKLHENEMALRSLLAEGTFGNIECNLMLNCDNKAVYIETTEKVNGETKKEKYGLDFYDLLIAFFNNNVATQVSCGKLNCKFNKDETNCINKNLHLNSSGECECYTVVCFKCGKPDSLASEMLNEEGYAVMVCNSCQTGRIKNE